MSDEFDNLESVLGRTADSVRKPPPIDPTQLVEVKVDSPEDEAHAYGEGLHDPTSGVRHGVWRFFYEDGELHSEVPYVEGKRHGHGRTWHPNGQLMADDHYVDGLREGKWEVFWEDGSPKRRGVLVKGHYAGRWWFRNRDGSWYEADMVDGEVHGLVRYYGPNDMLFALGEWDRGTHLWQITRVPGVGWKRVEFGDDGEPVDPEGVLLDRHPCPCCGYLTFPRGIPDDPDDEDAMCPVCGWISDFVQTNHPNASGMPNMYTLIESRKNFASSGAAVPGDERVRAPRDEEVPR